MLSLAKESESFRIENFGCQMNVADTAEIENSLLLEGYVQAEYGLADVVILNSCAVRVSAEERILGRLRHYSMLKAKKDFTLVLMGCVAQKEKENIFKKAPYVDLVIGTHQKHRLTSILKGHSASRANGVYSSFDGYSFSQAVPSTKYYFKADITIIHGCNKFCTYCIVPYTRGSEVSRSSSDIMQNVKSLVDSGVTEILLLGQNVNSYGQDNLDITFAELLANLNEINGLRRIRFLTSHPKDFTLDLVDVIAKSNKVCNYVHLPLQSASDYVLRWMKRDYTYEHYLGIISALRKRIANIVISTDILVGFPYEADGDFEMTLRAIKDIRYDQAFMFKYSVRTGTESANYSDIVGEDEKRRRLSIIIDCQHAISKEINHNQLNTVEEVLFEGISKNNSAELIGKTNGNKPVVVPLASKHIGQYKKVLLRSIKGNTFLGELIS